MAKITALPIADELDGEELLTVVQGARTKRVAMASFRNLITPYLQYWYKGDRGATGEAANTFTSLAALKAIDPALFPSTILINGSAPPVTYGFVEDDFTGQADDDRVVALDTVPLASGALVRQTSRSISFGRRSIEDKLNENISPYDKGAVGDGLSNDLAALQACIDARGNLPTGRFYIGSGRLRPRSGQTILGSGKSAWEPYLGAPGGVGSPFPTIERTVIVIDKGTTAWDLSGLNSVTIVGVTVRAKLGKQSGYGMDQGSVDDTVGFDITASSQIELIDIGMLGLAKGISADPAPGQPVAQMPHLSRIMASDCERVLAFGTAASSSYTVRDARIDGIVIALHCKYILDAHWCDGLRYEMNRLYQAKSNSIYMRKCNLVSIIGVTVFESTLDGVVLEDCEMVVMSGMTIARSGSYAATMPWAQRIGLRLTRCNGVSFEGLLEKTTGAPILIEDCVGIRIDATIDTPFWTTGNATNASGAINVWNSVAVRINGTITGNTACWIAVWADAKSARTLTGNVAADPHMGFTRALGLQGYGGHIIRLSAAKELGKGGGVAIDPIRVLLPAGKRLVTRSVEMTSGTVILRLGTAFWTNYATEPGGGSLAIDDKVLAENSTIEDRWVTIQPSLHNPSEASVTIPGGHETRISTAIVAM